MFAEPLRATIKPHGNDRSPDRPLRVGYVSPDLKQHAVGFFLEPILEHHDRNQFHIYCYSGVVTPDRVTQRMQAFGHTWRSIVGVRDEQVAEMIRADGIDILVDLSGHTSGTRLLIFARKPAPVQVAFLGYLNTTGMPTVDYRVTDAWADPPGMTDPFYSERIVRLPRCGWAFHPFEEAPDVADAPAAKNGYITFGSFNKLSKLSPPLIATWAELMKQVPTSRLLLKWSSLADASTRQRFHSLFAAHGISSDRIELAGATASMSDHLASYGRIDLALDTFPYNGATTTCDALWMGVPVVTLAGDTHAGRIGVSLLTAIGLPELIAPSPDQYVQIATDLANDPTRLSHLRQTMRPRVINSPLQDPLTLTRALEAAYRQMWHDWCISSG
jgi:predicted O-linked N-acetylglucosamine transferase (SPINDLY family)